MKLIPLYGVRGVGKFAQVDDEDYENLMKYRWLCVYALSSKNYYAVCNYKCGKGNWTNKKMHQMIMGKKDGLVIDHIDGDGLNNQKSNLRHCTSFQNMANKKKYKNCTSIYKGVNKTKYNTYIARITVNGKTVNLGSFKEEKDAAIAYNEAAKKYFGEYAKLNCLVNGCEPSIPEPPKIIKQKKEIPEFPTPIEGAKYIHIKDNFFMLVDESDYEMMSSYTWFLVRGSRHSYYAKTTRHRRFTPRQIYAHGLLLGKKEGLQIDHINGNPLDNRRCNLRFVTPKENSFNRIDHRLPPSGQFRLNFQ